MMWGKYRSRSRFLYARAYRALLRLLIQPLARWKPLTNPAPGYTLAIACHYVFPEILVPNFELVCKQDLRNLHCTIVSFDGPRTAKLAAAADSMRSRFPQLRLQFLYLDPLQALVVRLIRWGWVNCWLSYCKCIAGASTRYVMLHDMDAMLLDRNLVERRFQALATRGDHFLGVRWYTYGGLSEEDRLLYIVEMAFDAAFMRQRFRPIDLFNHVDMVNGKAIDLDTMLYPQLSTERKSVIPLTEQEWVHPSQVISQYTYLARDGNGYVAPAENNLFFIPYFLHLAGDAAILARHTASLSSADAARMPFLGYEVDLSRLTEVHERWVRKQVEQIEVAVAGRVRDDVEAYLRAIERQVQVRGDGVHRTPQRAAASA